MPPVMDAREVTDFLEEVWAGSTTNFVVEHVGERTARVRMLFAPERLRPGGIVAGPALMTLGGTAVLATGDVLMYTPGDPEPVCHAIVTYAIRSGP